MLLNYSKKENGLYILSKCDIEDIATLILKKYYPENLNTPIPLNTIELLEEHLGLSVKRKYIGTLESGILGLIVMHDEAEIPSYDDMYNPMVLQETYGTVLISQHLDGKDNISRRRYTEAHEGAHFILHTEYYNESLKSTVNRENKQFNYIACRKMEIYKRLSKNDADWMEWQADTLAAALLMPRDVFRSFAKSVIRQNGVSSGYLISSPYANKRQAFDIITEIAQKFNVSYRAAQIRMLHLGLIRKPNFEKVS